MTLHQTARAKRVVDLLDMTLHQTARAKRVVDLLGHDTKRVVAYSDSKGKESG